MSQHEYPRIVSQHETDQQAQAVLTGALAKGWVANELKGRDYGRDYEVEIVDAGSPGGRMFHIQLKGTTKLEFDNSGRATWPMETRHLRYYCERLRTPAFLVVVDVSISKGWFCFIQGAFDGEQMRKKLRDQDSVSVGLRLDHMISDHAKLRTSVDAAMKYMGERNPSSLSASFAGLALEIEKIDPNFTLVDAQVNEKNTRLQIKPRGPTSFSIQIRKGGGAAARLKDFLSYGKPVTLSSAEVKFSGLPLADHLASEGKELFLNLRGDEVKSSYLVLKGNRTHPFEFPIPVVINRGVDGACIHGQVPSAPLKFELKVLRSAIIAGGSGSISLGWDITAWLGKSIDKLPWLESITLFLRCLILSGKVRCSLTIEGRHITSSTIHGKKHPDVYKRILDLCEMLTSARHVLQHCGVDIALNDVSQLEGFDWEDVILAHKLLVEETLERKAPRLRMMVKQDPPPAVGPVTIYSAIRTFMNPYSIQAFGQVLEIGPVECDAGPVEYRIVSPASADGHTSEILGLPKTRMKMRKLKLAEIPLEDSAASLNQ